MSTLAERLAAVKAPSYPRDNWFSTWVVLPLKTVGMIIAAPFIALLYIVVGRVVK